MYVFVAPPDSRYTFYLAVVVVAHLLLCAFSTYVHVNDHVHTSYHHNY